MTTPVPNLFPKRDVDSISVNLASRPIPMSKGTANKERWVGLSVFEHTGMGVADLTKTSLDIYFSPRLGRERKKILGIDLLKEVREKFHRLPCDNVLKIFIKLPELIPDPFAQKIQGKPVRTHFLGTIRCRGQHISLDSVPLSDQFVHFIEKTEGDGWRVGIKSLSRGFEKRDSVAVFVTRVSVPKI